jgi:hypothetical protein
MAKHFRFAPILHARTFFMSVGRLRSEARLLRGTSLLHARVSDYHPTSPFQTVSVDSVQVLSPKRLKVALKSIAVLLLGHVWTLSFLSRLERNF